MKRQFSLEKLEKRRTELGLTKSELASRAGLVPATITHLFGRKNSSPTLRTVLGIASALECKIEDLLEDVEEDEEASEEAAA